jgi:hypothetical protein
MERAYQPLSDEVLSRLKAIVALLEKDAQDQFRDLDHFEEMFESISQELPEDMKTSLSSVYGLDTLYAPIKHALRKLRSRPAIEKKKADAEHAMTGAQSQVESHKDTLANLQASCDLSGTQKDCQELLDNSRLITSNARGVIAKYLNISMPVLMYSRVGRPCNIFLQFVSFLLRTFKHNAERPIRQRNANSRTVL